MSNSDYCIYFKGGSAYFIVSGNTIHNCGTTGFGAGQSTGLQVQKQIINKQQDPPKAGDNPCPVPDLSHFLLTVPLYPTQYTVPPWFHFEAYDVKFVNNVLHDIDGAGGQMGIGRPN